MQNFAIFVVFLFCLGCAKTMWVHPYKTQDQYGPDRWSCEQELAARQMVTYKRLGNLSWASGAKVEEEDVDRCMILKYGWEKRKIPR